MTYRKYITLVFCLLCSSLCLSAQNKSLEEMDITGLWKGFMYNDTVQKNFRYEIAISEEKGKLFGYSHTFFILDDKEYSGVKKLKITRDGNEITTEDVDLIANNYPVKPPKGIHMKNVLVFTLKDTVMILSGFFTTNTTRVYSRNTGFVHVERKNNYKQSALVPHLEELGLAKNLTFLKEENKIPAEEIVAVLQPLPTDEEEKIIVARAKLQQPENTLQKGNAPVIKPEEIKVPVEKPAEPEVAKITPPVKKPETVVSKPVEQPKTATNEVAKATPPVKKPEAAVSKPAEPVVTKPVTNEVVKTTPAVKQPAPVVTKAPPVKQPETVVANKPTPPKTETPTIVKAPPVKVPEPVSTKPAVVKQPDPIDPLAAINANNRKVENIQALYFKSDSLQLILYDNGEVDGDTVSVIMNGQVIMPRVGLSTNAVKKMIDTKEAGDSIQLVMYAETLGSLPPNTGLLIVYDGNDRYEIRFSGDMQKSSGIVFRRRKP